MTSTDTQAASCAAAALSGPDFDSFFEAVHGFAPYPWQSRLARMVVDDGCWPDQIDMPTGAGKTAVLDVAVFALAARPATTPRRVVFVVDRRTIVDQAYTHASAIQRALQDSRDPTTRRVADRLRRLNHGGVALGGTTLRGGIRHPGGWATSPDAGWVTVTTVDQFGSRLLFRAYGASPGARPIQAGLAGNDCLVICTEAHLCNPFLQTARAVDAHQRRSSGELPRRYTIVEMSATPARSEFGACDKHLACRAAAAPPRTVITLDEKDQTDPRLLRIVTASKHARVVPIGWQHPHRSIPAATLRLANSLRPHERTIGVVVNRVRTARETHRCLVEAGHRAHLVTGRMRPMDRDFATDAIADAVNPDRAPYSPIERVFVVATQCIEAGADFSFDALVTETAPTDSLKQRFGRLDRRGSVSRTTNEAARSWILGPGTPTRRLLDNDAVYGSAVGVAWDTAHKRRSSPLDVSPLSPLWAQFPDTAIAARLDADLLLPAHLDLLAQTNPTPAQEPALGSLLHGRPPTSEAARHADVGIVWRHDRTLGCLRQVPPRPAEIIHVPFTAARAWLSSQPERPVSDITAQPDETGPAGDTPAEDWVRWEGSGTTPAPIAPRDIRGGDILIVDPLRGGLSHGTWNPNDTSCVTDLGDGAQHAYQHRLTLRLDPRIHPSAPTPTEDADIPARERITDWLRTSGPQNPWADHFANTADFQILNGGDSDYWILITADPPDPGVIDGSDHTNSIAGTAVPLHAHLSGVADLVCSYARNLALPDRICADLRLAAQLHDVGKAHPGFQQQLTRTADNPDPTTLLARSLPDAVPDPARWPAVYHELLSAAMAQHSARLRTANDPDLVLHLIASHHGRARGLPLLRPDPDPITVTYDNMTADTARLGAPQAIETAQRFWNLAHRYGHYGLAWLETILRQAVHQRSAQERLQP